MRPFLAFEFPYQRYGRRQVSAWALVFDLEIPVALVVLNGSRNSLSVFCRSHDKEPGMGRA